MENQAAQPSDFWRNRQYFLTTNFLYLCIRLMTHSLHNYYCNLIISIWLIFARSKPCSSFLSSRFLTLKFLLEDAF
ncbi:hypothetical protein RDI58_029015 [Solanum bulbocastanum]|uniref:Uncharacterized protein n=1 Tax=Solanum bulbocastanum TaxID=147425 RepID=A0AAN8SW31_SOLBU